MQRDEPPGAHRDPGVEDSRDWIQTKLEVARSQNRWFKLALGMHGYYLTTMFHVAVAGNMLFSSYLGFLPWDVAIQGTAVLVAIDLLVYFMLKRGYNLRSRDPHLMVLRLVQLVAILLYVQIYAGPTKVTCIAAILIGFMLASTHAKLRTMLRLNLLTVIAYLATIPLMKSYEGTGFNLKAELFNWSCFAAALPGAVFFGGIVSELRASLSNSNAQLADALHQVTELATTDELTKAYNRRYLREMMDHEVSRVARGGPTFSVLLMDIDHFKRVNDVHGHKIGDLVLKAFTEVATAAKRDGDLFARWGGEEFLLFMPQTNLSTARTAAERIRRATQELQIAEVSDGASFTVSIGAAEFSEHEKLSDLIERADRALYRAKQTGRNRVESAAPLLLSSG